MSEEYEYDGHTYQLSKLGLREAQDGLKMLQSMGFFDNGLEALVSGDTAALERKLFGENVRLLNEQGEWVPMGKAITENHFDGRLPAYFGLLLEAISHNFADFLGGGWATNLGEQENKTE